MGKMVTVEPYSGLMLPNVARVASGTLDTPGPKKSTNLPTTPVRRNNSATVSTRSVAVVPSGSSPVSLRPTAWGMSMLIGWPSIAASASIPPTPQPSTPSPLIIGVWESVPTSVGIGQGTPGSVLGEHHPGEVLQVDLVADPGVRRPALGARRPLGYETASRPIRTCQTSGPSSR